MITVSSSTGMRSNDSASLRFPDETQDFKRFLERHNLDMNKLSHKGRIDIRRMYESELLFGLSV